MKDFKGEPIRDAKLLGTGSMLLMGLQHMVAMFGATVLVPILVGGFFKDATGEPISQGMTVAVTLFCAGFGTLVFHVCSKFKVPAFLGSSFAFLGGFYTVANLNAGIYAGMGANEKAAYACGGVVIAGLAYFILALIIKLVGMKKVMRFLHRTLTGRFCHRQRFHQLVPGYHSSGNNRCIQRMGQGAVPDHPYPYGYSSFLCHSPYNAYGRYDKS